MLMFFLRLLWISAVVRRGSATQGAAISVIERPPEHVAHRPEQTEYGREWGSYADIAMTPVTKRRNARTPLRGLRKQGATGSGFSDGSLTACDAQQAKRSL